MSYEEPLAKSGEQGNILLSEHLRQVADYARAIAEAYYPHWQYLLGEEWTECVKRALILAALTHDFGKVAEGFQRALRSRKHRWEFRHEVLSAALLLASTDSNDEMVTLTIAAVLTHHRDLNDAQLNNDVGMVAVPDPDVLRIAQDRFSAKAKELRAHWSWLKAFCSRHAETKQLQLPDTPNNLPLPTNFLEDLKQSLRDTWFPHDHKAMALLLTRGWLMAADHAASAGVAKFKTNLPAPSLPPLRPFQEHIGDHEGDAFLEAPTGSGKTIAALLWALRNRRYSERIFYLLPYQASIEAMAKTLEKQLGESGAEYISVLHARALDYAFREYFEQTGEYEMAYAQAKSEVDINRLAHKPVKVATPFQLLKWLFGVPRFEMGISEMVGGLFIFDEIHAYDTHIVALIAEMVRMLRQFNGRFLFMSATFPRFLKELLREALGEEALTFGLNQRDGDKWTQRFLKKTRHILRWHDGTIEDMLPSVIKAIRQGRRVLVVANRVAQAQEIYRRLYKQFSGVHLLHSRFTRRDRVEKERIIIDALQGKPKGVEVRALVATQVVEVSLDISFDTIFTEIAPVDDLLQRFGRVNRYGEHPKGVEVYVAKQFDEERLRWIYDLERIRATMESSPNDGEPLTVELAAEWMRKAYQGGWTAKERQRFEQAKGAFRGVLHSLRPLHHITEGKEEFFGLLQSIEVLPCRLYNEYQTLMRNKHYLLATQLLVSIPFGTFHILNKAGKLHRLKDGVLMVDASYHPELGLLPKESELDSCFH